MSPIGQRLSQLLDQVQIDRYANWTRIKFAPPLKIRQGTLLDKRSQQALSPEESAELDAIQDLNTICDFLNHQMVYQRHSSLR